MDVLLLCGYFESKYQNEIAQKTKTWVENASNTFQQRLIAGLKSQQIHLTVVSAPLFGAWPNTYTDVFFRGFQNGSSDEDITYVSFCNIWGYRNISRTKALKKAVKDFLKTSHDDHKAIIVYSVHTPYLEAAVFAKKLDPAIHVHMVVPDLPQFMNLSKRSHPIYDFFKRIDIGMFQRLNEDVDTYTILTKHMAEKLRIGNKPYIVVEGIADHIQIPEPKTVRGKTIAYAGKLEEAFGVRRLLEAFMLLQDPDARLEICGGGELKPYVMECAQRDSRIVYRGLVTAEESRNILQAADVLVNPRQNDSEYTKYSFPSKNIEYLLTGNPVVAYMLDGMPEVYRDFLSIPVDNSIISLKEQLMSTLMVLNETESKRLKRVKCYISAELQADSIAKKIMFMCKM